MSGTAIDDLDLFTWRPAPSVPVRSSQDAARRIEPFRGGLCATVLAHVAERGGATCDECETALGMSHQTASARIRDLVRAGRLRDSGETRRTRTGRSAVVWVDCGANQQRC